MTQCGFGPVTADRSGHTGHGRRIGSGMSKIKIEIEIISSTNAITPLSRLVLVSLGVEI